MSKRLLFLIHSLSMGGAERVTVNLANYWAGRGYTVAVATLSNAANDAYALDPTVERIALNVAKPSRGALAAVANNLRILRDVRRLLRQWQPEITIAMMTKANVYLALAGWGLTGHKIGSEHNYPPASPLETEWEMLRRWTYGWLDHIVALTELNAVWLRDHTNARHIPVIGNAVPWPLAVQPPVVDTTTILHPHRQNLLAVGRLVELKGFDLLLEAFAQLAPTHPEWDLIILGEGHLRPHLEAQIEKSKLQSRAVLVGNVGNVGDWYAACDIYVMSSRSEGFPNTLVEAVTHAIPVVSFDCDTGPRDIIRHGVDGLLVPNGDVAALVETLSKLMQDADLRKKLATKVTEARERFSLEQIAGLWEALFAKSANRH